MSKPTTPIDLMATWMVDWLISCPVPVDDEAVFGFVYEVICGIVQGTTDVERAKEIALAHETIDRTMRLQDEMKAWK